MKAACTFILVFYSICLTTYGQKKIPAFGQVDLEDLQMTSCPYDADAEAFKLLDIASVKYGQGRNFFRLETERRVRIKILKDRGIGEANIKIPFYAKLNTERITNLEGITYNLAADGSITTSKLGKDAIYIQKLNNRISTMTFTLPEVKAGSIIEYKFLDLDENFTSIEDWSFQDNIPTRYSSLKVEIPQYFNFIRQVLAYQKVEQSSHASQDRINTLEGVLRFNTVVASYTMEDVTSLRSEPFMSSFKDYQQRVQFQLSGIDFGNGNSNDYRTSWPKLTKELLEDEDFGVQLGKNIPRTKDLDQLLLGVTDAQAKMKIIYNYVRANMTWNGRENVFTDGGIKDAWDKKNGSNAEINMILINLLKDANVPVYPILVSTRDHGATNPIYPFLGQFNGVYAYLQFDGHTYVLNAADKYNPSRLIPYDVLNTDAFLLSKDGGKWITLENQDHRWKNSVIISAEISNEGLMTGQAVVNSYDYSKNPRTKRYLEHKGSFSDYFTDQNPSLKVEEVTVNNVEADSMPLEQTVKFSSKLNSSGDYKYFSVNLFSGLESNPFIADNRVTDVDFGYNQSYTINGTIFLPPGYQVDDIPKNVSMMMPDTSILLKRLMQVDDNILNFRITVDFSRPYYTVQDYAYFKEFNKQLYTKLNEQVVIKKKTGTP